MSRYRHPPLPRHTLSASRTGFSVCQLVPRVQWGWSVSLVGLLFSHPNPAWSPNTEENYGPSGAPLTHTLYYPSRGRTRTRRDPRRGEGGGCTGQPQDKQRTRVRRSGGWVSGVASTVVGVESLTCSLSEDRGTREGGRDTPQTSSVGL